MEDQKEKMDALLSNVIKFMEMCEYTKSLKGIIGCTHTKSGSVAKTFEWG